MYSYYEIGPLQPIGELFICLFPVHPLLCSVAVLYRVKD